MKSKWYDHRKSQSKYKHNMWSNQYSLFFASTSFHMKYSFKKLQKESNWWNKSRNFSDYLMRLLQHPETLPHQSYSTTFFPPLFFFNHQGLPFWFVIERFWGSRNHRQMESRHEKHISRVDCPTSAPAVTSTGYWLRPQTTRPSMRATAAIAISLILHCIPQKVTGMEAEASGEEAAVATHRQFQWATRERGLQWLDRGVCVDEARSTEESLSIPEEHHQ